MTCPVSVALLRGILDRMPQSSDDTIGSLERARERLYRPDVRSQSSRVPLPSDEHQAVPHQWEEKPLPTISHQGKQRVRLAGIFFIAAFAFFLVSLVVAGYFFYFGGNAVSTDKISINIQGPTTIAGGDVVPLSLTITNKNAAAIENVTIEIDFPSGTRNANDVMSPYPRYTENLGRIASGATVTRSLQVVLFGGAGQALALPVSFSFGTAASNAVFVKKTSYALAISSSPLSVSVDTLSETVSGKPFTLTLTVRSSANVPLSNVVLAASFPFGFSVTSSSLPLDDSSFRIGTLKPNGSKTVTITGVLLGQDNDQRVFHFTVGTAATPQDQTLAVTYMSQDVTVAIAAPFISTTLAINGSQSANPVLNAGGFQTVSISYANKLTTSIQNATVAVTVSGSAVDYNSIKTSDGFYRSSDHTIIFSSDTDPSLATLAPGASGIGTFTFSTLAVGALPASPSASFSVSVSGTPAGQSGITQATNASAAKTAKVVTTITLSAASLHNSGSLNNSGPIPPRADQATTYTVVWNARNVGSAVAGATVTTVLPSYVSYTNMTAGAGSFSYDQNSRAVSWNIGDIPQNGNVAGSFQVSLTPSTSQQGSTPALTKNASFSGYDRFAGVQVSATAGAVTTETTEDPGYVEANAIVQ